MSKRRSESMGKKYIGNIPWFCGYNRKEAFYQKYDENQHQYLVLNYDKFNQEDSPNLILNLAKQKVDFVVLDEIHFVKKRDEESSQRRKNLDGLMTAVRKRNRNA